jgi:glycolate oxidase FAD binding subunit
LPPDPEDIFAKMKGGMMRPESEAELSEVILAAKALVLQGGGTRGLGVPVGEVLQTGGLSGVSLYEPGALTLVARAGTPVAEVQALLAGERQRLGFEVPDLRGLLRREGDSTLGGVVAANASGPRRVQVGACRDALLGVRFVDGSGAVIKNGGRVMKNVTGYDLVKLMAGSYGSLGVITEVSFKVQAVPEAEVTLVAERGLAEGLANLRRALGSPFDISGAGWMAGRAMIRIEGMAGSVAYRAERLRALLGDWQEAVGDWQALRDVTPFAAREGAVWRLAVTPTATAEIVEALGLEAICDWGGALVWLLDPTGLADVRGVLGAERQATLLRALPAQSEVATFPPEAAAVAGLTHALRAKFDPRGVFNQGMRA